MKLHLFTTFAFIAVGCSIDDKPDYCETHKDDSRCTTPTHQNKDSVSEDQKNTLDIINLEDQLIVEDESVITEDGITDIAFDEETATEENDSDTLDVVGVDTDEVEIEDIPDVTPEIMIDDIADADISIDDTLDTEDSIANEDIPDIVPDSFVEDVVDTTTSPETEDSEDSNEQIDTTVSECVSDSDCKPIDFCSVPTCDTEKEKCIYTPIGPCDDGVECTDDSCDPNQGCIFIANDSMCATTAPCTSSLCNPETDCEVTLINGTICDDNSICTEDDQCENGICKGTDIVPCVCDFDVDCAPSDDGNWCNGTWKCNEFHVCYFDANIVFCPKDNNTLCATSTCNTLSGLCEMIPEHEDETCVGAKCLVSAVCKSGLCKTTPIDCNDNNPCTIDTCDDSNGCTYSSSTEVCDDGNICTHTDLCSNKVCKGTEINCDDATNCTIDTCDNIQGCISTTDDSLCVTDVCGVEICKTIEGCVAVTVTECNDNNPCTKDSCNSSSGCVSTLQSGPPCNDNSPCTHSDTCVGGFCVGINMCECQKDSDCGLKEDGNFCNGTLYCDTTKLPYSCEIDLGTIIECNQSGVPGCKTYSCDTKDGKCVFANKQNGIVCADNKCLEGSVCSSGMCTGGAKIDCEDGIQCTTDSCEGETGCIQTTTPDKSCNDGNATTVADHCISTVCKGTTQFMENFQDGLAQGWTFENSEANGISWGIYEDYFNPNAPDPLYVLGVITIPGTVLLNEVIVRATTPLFEVPQPVAPLATFAPQIWYWRMGGINCDVGAFRTYLNGVLVKNICGETVTWEAYDIGLQKNTPTSSVTFEYMFHKGIALPDSRFYRVDLVHTDFNK